MAYGMDAGLIERVRARLKREYPDHLVLIKMGDFYEAFGADAYVISDVCQMSLSPISATCNLPHAGIPYHGIERFTALLVARGYRVAVVDKLPEIPSSTPYPVKRVSKSRRKTLDNVSPS